MPALGAMDPANLQAQARAELFFSWQLEQPRRTSPHPVLGGSGGYARWFREEQLQKFHAGEAIEVLLSSIYRWAIRLEPYRQTGNAERTQIRGADLLNIVTYITTWPDATLDEMVVFVYNEGRVLYSRQTISKRLKELEITKKKASTEAYQAQRPDVQLRVWEFWNCPHPSRYHLLSLRGYHLPHCHWSVNRNLDTLEWSYHEGCFSHSQSKVSDLLHSLTHEIFCSHSSSPESYSSTSLLQ